MGDARERQTGATSGLARGFLVGALYVGTSAWGTSAFRIVVGIALARLLGPEILGFYALVFSASELIGIVGGFSMGLALIQATRTSQVHEDTAFALAGVLGLIGIAAALALAPLLSAERTPIAGWLLVLLGGGRLVSLLGNVVLAKLERSLDYRRVALTNAAAGVLSGLVALGLAWKGFGVWSLLAQDLLLATLLLGLAWTLSGYRFRGRVDRGVASELFAFGRGVFASRAIEVALQRLDRLAIGSFLGDARLGLYHQGRVLAETGVVIERPLERISLNLFSRLRERPDRLGDAFALTQFFLVRAMFAGTAVLLVAPEQTIHVLLGPEWSPAAPLLQAMALHAGLAPLLSHARQLLYGRGRVGQAVGIRTIQLLCFLPGLFLAISYEDVRIAAFALTISTGLALALTLWLARDVAGPPLLRDFAAPCTALLASLSLRLPALREALALLPPIAQPLIPALVFVVFLGALDRGRLVRNLRTLWDAFGHRDPEPRNPGEPMD